MRPRHLATLLLTLIGAPGLSCAQVVTDGSVEISAGDNLVLRGGSITTSVFSGVENAGVVSLPDSTALTRVRGSIVRANADAGNGGAVDVVTALLLESADSRIEAKSRLGVDGIDDVSPPKVDVAGSVAMLPSNFSDPGSLLADHCGVHEQSRSSTFTLRGRGTTAWRPDRIFVAAAGGCDCSSVSAHRP